MDDLPAVAALFRPHSVPDGDAAVGEGAGEVKFESAFEAYHWAQGILIPWRSGHAFDPDPELFRGGTGGIGLSILIAIDINHIAEKACRGGHPCRYYDGNCMMNWYLPEPTIPLPERSSHHIRNIEDCLQQFEVYLKMRGYIE